jgi:hypothetical protein
MLMLSRYSDDDLWSGYTCAYVMMDTLNLGTPQSGREIKPCATNQNEVCVSSDLSKIQS